MKKISVSLLEYTPQIDDEGDVFKTTTEVGAIRGILIPVNSELASKDFGFDENVSHRFFCKDKHPAILVGNVVRYLGSDYPIIHIADYGKVRVLHLNTVIGGKSSRTIVQSVSY